VDNNLVDCAFDTNVIIPTTSKLQSTLCARIVRSADLWSCGNDCDIL